MATVFSPPETQIQERPPSPSQTRTQTSGAKMVPWGWRRGGGRAGPAVHLPSKGREPGCRAGIGSARACGAMPRSTAFLLRAAWHLAEPGAVLHLRKVTLAVGDGQRRPQVREAARVVCSYRNRGQDRGREQEVGVGASWARTEESGLQKGRAGGAALSEVAAPSDGVWVRLDAALEDETAREATPPHTHEEETCLWKWVPRQGRGFLDSWPGPLADLSSSSLLTASSGTPGDPCQAAKGGQAHLAGGQRQSVLGRRLEKATPMGAPGLAQSTDA